MLYVNAINFAFAKAETLKNISFQLKQGTITAVMGESGCGKSTLLNMIYGLLQSQSGKILWNDKELLGADHHLVPGHTMMKYVPQEFDLMPYTTVFENVGEYLSIQLENRESRIAELLQIVEMETYSSRKVKTLSGGQKQRVAIAKALAQEPQLLLLDEPFSHVDNFRKNKLRRALFQYLKEKNISALMATHDREDVLSFTNETIIMRDGEIIDHRKTDEVYTAPINHYSASLFDDVNSIPAGFFGNEKPLLLHPHQMKVTSSGKSAIVLSSYFKGEHYLIHCQCDDQNFWIKSNSHIAVSTSILIDIT